MSNYFISKDNKTGEIVYLEYDKESCYKVMPKTKKKGAIEVNKIVFVSPSLTEKLIKKKIDHKISKLLLELNTFYDDEDDGGVARFRNQFMEAEKLKLNIINKYQNYLGKSYYSLTLKKIELIIDGYRSKLYEIRDRKQKQMLIDMFNRYNREDISEKKGKGR